MVGCFSLYLSLFTFTINLGSTTAVFIVDAMIVLYLKDYFFFKLNRTDIQTDRQANKYIAGCEDRYRQIDKETGRQIYLHKPVMA